MQRLHNMSIKQTIPKPKKQVAKKTTFQRTESIFQSQSFI